MRTYKNVAKRLMMGLARLLSYVISEAVQLKPLLDYISTAVCNLNYCC
jgi:hypothetical protein